MFSGCFVPCESCFADQETSQERSFEIFRASRPFSLVEPSSNSKNYSQKTELQCAVSTSKIYRKPDETKEKGEQQAASVSSTSPSPEGFQRSIEVFVAESRSKNSEQNDEDNIAVKSENEYKLKINGINKTTSYDPCLSRSPSLSVIVEPDDDDLYKFHDVVIEGDTNDIMKLKNENLQRENMIREILIQNENLRTTVGSRNHRRISRRSSKLGAKINDLQRLSTSSPCLISHAGTETSQRTETIKSMPLLSHIGFPLRFRYSLEEVDERCENNCGLKLLRKDGSNWSLSEFNVNSWK